MIYVTRLDGKPIVLNAECIQSIEHTPDTLITLTTGAQLLVREPLPEVVEAFKRYKREIRELNVLASGTDREKDGK